MAKKTKKVVKAFKKKKKLIRQVAQGIVYIQSSFNNVIMTLTDTSGNTLGWVTAGSLGFKGTKKSTPYTASLIGKAMLEKIKKYGISELKIFVSGVGQGRDAAARALSNANVNIVSIADITPVPHNGCRPKKPRRV
ncbi:MAG TPA: 30S ribosomal protein S11 [Patescibacteria group bacterium]|uniref:Small ribosomal subunit protein uS11 n=1 Tax=uncultured Berkelbacteria bacterium Rifle_16ft_4_minimus_38443 TaxID=1665092 RepID=A0A0H4TB06_9BACT|nr:SSU ribosomal protein S11P [uncultured Berkelbacteria bacterium Rifle_16ft_4_minimus_38443]HLC38577.1 30S ribosomal protein S11 [Patescibacteria group bacterium]